MKLLGRLCVASGIGLLGLVPALRMSQPSSAHARTYVVQANDTLSAIAIQFHTSVQELMSRNGILNPNNLEVGQALVLDGITDNVAVSSSYAGQQSQTRSSWSNQTMPTNNSELGRPDRYRTGGPAGTGTYSTASYSSTTQNSGVQSASTAASLTQSTEQQDATVGDSSYTVTPGDTLAGVSTRFGVSISTLLRSNSLADPNIIRVGQRLVIPGSGSTATSVPNALNVRSTSIGSGQSRVMPAVSTSLLGSSGVSAITTPSVATTGSSVLATGVTTTSQNTGLASQSTIGSLLSTEAAAYGIDPALVKAVAWQESGWQMVVARDGGIGVMQLMPATAAYVGPSLLGRTINPYNVQDNIQAGVALLASYMTKYNGNVTLALAAYNEGPANLTRGILSSTSQYIASVLSLRGRFS